MSGAYAKGMGAGDAAGITTCGISGLLNSRKTQAAVKTELAQADYRKSDAGGWSLSANGHTQFLETAIQRCKEAAARCAEHGLENEHRIFIERAKQLEQRLLSVKQAHSENE